jgi:hypothetical protein
VVDVAALHGAGYRLVLRDKGSGSDAFRQADLFGPDGLISPAADPIVVDFVDTELGSRLLISEEVMRQIDGLIDRIAGPSARSDRSDDVSRSRPIRIYSRTAVINPIADEDMLDRLGRLGDALLQSFGFSPPPPVPDSMTATPAAFTYLGQFLAHELTVHHPAGSSRKAASVPIIDSAIDLKTVFLRPFDFPKVPPAHVVEVEGLALSKTIVNSGPMFPGGGLEDVPRSENGSAMLFERRNDQNLAVSQTHVVVTRFAQAMLQILKEISSGDDPHVAVIRYFQSVVLQDYLPRIVDPETYDDVMRNGRVYVAPSGGVDNLEPFYVPVEFSTAIFRFGHSMVRDDYAPWNTEDPNLTVPSALASDLLGFSFAGGSLTDGRLLQSWTADWGHLLGLLGKDPIKARAIGTKLSKDLFCLPKDLFLSSDLDRPCLGTETSNINLARRTLMAGGLLGLPTGQTLAKLVQEKLDAAGSPCRIPILTPDELEIPENPKATAIMLEGTVGSRFVDQTPLWVYILREAAVCDGGNRLGPLGSRFVAETLSAAVEASGSGMIIKGIRQPFKADPIFGGRSLDKFDYADLVRLAFIA